MEIDPCEDPLTDVAREVGVVPKTAAMNDDKEEQSECTVESEAILDSISVLFEQG